MKRESNRVTVTQAAAELGISPQALRERLKQGIGEIALIGEVLPQLQGGRRLRYMIFRDRLDRYLGKGAGSHGTGDTPTDNG